MEIKIKATGSEQSTKASQYAYMGACLDYVAEFIEARLKAHYGNKEMEYPVFPIPREDDHSSLALFYRKHALTEVELLLIMIALVPHIVPGFFDQVIQRILPGGGDLPEIGGIKGQQHRGTLPTGETVLFILAGTHPDARLRFLHVFDEHQFLFKQKILILQPGNSGEPRLSGRLLMEKEFVEVFTTGRVSLPKLSMDFPAEHISTEMEWTDLVLNCHTLDQIHEMEHWINHHETLMGAWGMSKKLKPGYRALFYGPPGTGKTLTAMLLGKYTGRDVFRIDLSMVVSKYIGETEKNLASLFERAEHKNWILFFDEADAIFGKRTGVRDAHDKYANQEVSYLLQRIESHHGLSILASNFKNNIDQAFIRRFNAMIYFPNPVYEEKLLLWQKAYPRNAQLAGDVLFETIAASYELNGAQIMNIVQYTCLQSLADGGRKIALSDIEAGIRRELAKEGK